MGWLFDILLNFLIELLLSKSARKKAREGRSDDKPTKPEPPPPITNEPLHPR